MRKLALAFITTTALAGITSASAADLPARVYTKAPVMAPAFNWTGFYLGANVGGAFADGSGTFTSGAGAGTLRGDSQNFLGGGQIGYNWQAPGSPWVFGLEADIQGVAGNGNISGTVGGAPFVGNTSVDWFTTFRGRIGYAAWDRTMLYVTGGGVYGQNNATITTPAFASSANADFLTYTVGGGIETMLWDRWSGKLEYLYVGSPDRTAFQNLPGVTSVNGNIDTHIVRAGLNYHF